MASESNLVLLIDPDSTRHAMIAQDLRKRGFGVQGFAVRPSLDAISADVQLVILAADPPAAAACELCRLLRVRHPRLPLMLIESSGTYQARIAALQAGADDVQSFPCSLQEFALRLQALLRRINTSPSLTSDSFLLHKDLCMDLHQRLVQRAGEPVRLTIKEYDLLLFFLQHSEQILPRQQIMKAVWGESWVGDGNLLDVYIRYLRKKIDLPHLEPLIHTVRGVGFVLR